MIKLLVFDMDGTLAPLREPACKEVRHYLTKWENSGITIGLSSGKNTEYLMGFARAAGVAHPVAFGETGATLHDGKRFLKVQFASRHEDVKTFAKLVVERFGRRVFFQDNVIALSIFTDGDETSEEVKSFVQECGLVGNPHLIVHFQPDGVADILPAGCDKGTSLLSYMNEYGITKEEVIAVGDSFNDLPMAQVAGRFIIVGSRISVPDAVHVNSTLEMLEMIDKLV